MKLVTVAISFIALLFLCSVPSVSMAEGEKVISEKDVEKSIEHQEKGNILDEQGEFDKAIEEYNKSLSYNPDDPNTLFNLGFVYLKVDKPAESVKIFTRLRDILPQDYEVCNMLGVAHSGAGNKLEAIQVWRKSLELQKDQPKVVKMIDEMKIACEKEGIKVED